ncbi:D-Ala-D-Ala carboxypeptidase family metallohydrolase [Ancylobacter sp.]|uniref:D-Ala-D-Ala carboxypeptidase family metallohydrolase n=1 Tax=Ancylobacter sp. TaxID=1872567 RepID=UPI003C7C18A0
MDWNDIQHFKVGEFDSSDQPGSGQKMVLSFVAKLDALRTLWGRPMRVTSGYRTKTHNRAVGGTANSAHLRGRAADIHIMPEDQAAFAKLARQVGMTGIGYYRSWVHLDDMTLAEGYSRPTEWPGRGRSGE